MSRNFSAAVLLKPWNCGWELSFLVLLDHVLYAIVWLRRRWREWRKFSSVDQYLDFVRIKDLALDQCPRHLLQRVAVLGENLLGRVVAAVDQLTNFLVNLDGRVFAVITMLGNFSAQEDLLFLFPEGQGTKLTHAPLAYHLARHIGRTLDVVACAGAHHIE